MFNNLEAELSRIRMTKGALAKALDLTPGTVSLKLNGKAPLTFKEAIQIKQMLKVDIPMEELFAESTQTAS